jgi:hypothetical protein
MPKALARCKSYHDKSQDANARSFAGESDRPPSFSVFMRLAARSPKNSPDFSVPAQIVAIPSSEPIFEEKKQ